MAKPLIFDPARGRRVYRALSGRWSRRQLVTAARWLLEAAGVALLAVAAGLAVGAAAGVVLAGCYVIIVANVHEQ